MGLITSGVTCLVIFGGVKSIARVCETLSVIFRSAFTQMRSIAGGLAGSGIMMSARYGIARGLFSNESGMGSAPIVAAAAQTLVSSIIGHDSISVTNLPGVIVKDTKYYLAHLDEKDETPIPLADE